MCCTGRPETLSPLVPSRRRAWGAFLSTILYEWVTRDVGQVFVQHFDITLGALFGQYSLRVHAPECGTAIVRRVLTGETCGRPHS